jgi:hypothetical protein
VALLSQRSRPWALPQGAKRSFKPAGYYLGGGDTPLEVAVAESPSRPTESDVRTLWKKRRAATPSPLLLVVLWPGLPTPRASVCGTTGDDPPVYSDRDPEQVARLASLALEEPDHHAAVRFLGAYLPEEAGGLRNVSLFSTHHLVSRVPARPDWTALCEQGLPMLSLRREQLVQALGYTVEPRGNAAVLRAAGNARALAVFLDDSENPDITNARFNGMTPISWAIASAAADNIPYVVVTRGPQIRVYAARERPGAAGKAGSAAFVEVNLPLLTADDAGYLPLLFGATSLADGGEFERLLAESHDFAASLGGRLRSRVYDYAVPVIAQALIARHERDGGDTGEAARRALYDTALLILFRLLFIAYAEDKELLPLRANGLYRQRSLKHIARELADLANANGWEKVPFDDHATDLWDNVRTLWNAVDKGRKDWNVPAYNGGMFSSDVDIDASGAEIAALQLTNAEIGPALLGLLVDADENHHWGPVDFASLDVREFGTIYEGLLESSLAVASVDLRLKGGTGSDADAYIPANPGEEVLVPAGRVYLHGRSGARKDSGTYFTKPFAVAHLLDMALEPALDAHLARLAKHIQDGDDATATEAFFDIRVADLAMGSGHFLVAAVDRIEHRLSTFLADHRVSGVLDELARVGEHAKSNLADAGLPSDGVDTNALLRRQIARRCIYGIELNRTAVELARLALWIHTFVRGLPLTNLDHGLVVGDSTTGVSSVADAIAVLMPKPAGKTKASGGATQATFLQNAIEEAAGGATAALARFARTSEATAAEVRQARAAHDDAMTAINPAERLFDLAVAIRMKRVAAPANELTEAGVMEIAEGTGAVSAAAEVNALHIPAAFPEVFFRDDPGFDCILGNPPWEKLKFEPQAFWVTRFPGLNALSDEKRDREIDDMRVRYPEDAAEEAVQAAEREVLQALVKETYSLLGVGHYDLAKIFVERAMSILRSTGTLGYVLPRSALVLGGWGPLRKALLEGEAVTTAQARNKGGWLFENVHHSYMVTLLSRVAVTSARHEGVLIWPDVASPDAVRDLRTDDAVVLTGDEVRDLSDSYVVPWFNTARDRFVFDKMRSHPRLAKDGGWITGIHDARWDFRASGPNRAAAAGEKSGEGWRVLMTRHVSQYSIDRDDSRFQKWVADPASLGKGIEVDGDGRAFLSRAHPMIVVRHPSRNDDSRTLIASALSERGELHAKGYVHAVAHGADASPEDLLALLAFMNTFTCDWWVRRFVDRHVTAPVVNNIPLPSWNAERRHEAAALASAMLARRGTARLAGGIETGQSASMKGRSDLDLALAAELMALDGFGLGREDAEVIVSDFSESEDACSSVFRLRLMGEVA